MNARFLISTRPQGPFLYLSLLFVLAFFGGASKPATVDVTLTLGPKWAPHQEDLVLMVGDKIFFHEIRLDEANQVKFSIQRVAKERSICLRFIQGARSGKSLDIACYLGHIKSDIKLKLTDKNQLVRLK
jgi:hypothetical protein